MSRRLIVITAAVIVLGAAVAWFALGGPGVRRAPQPLLASLPRPLVFAHRGGAGEAPEGTLAAIVGANVRDPAVGIEMDVRATRDGNLVVLHDATVDRTTNGRGRVADLTLAELRALDAGFCATPGARNGTARRGECQPDADGFPFRGKGHKIATLDEVLAALPPRALLSIEIKAAGYEEKFAATVRAAGRLGRLIVGSADDDVAARLRQLLPEVAHYLPRKAATCLALTAKLGFGSDGCGPYDVFATPRSAVGLDLATAGMIAAMRARGVPAVYFTVNDESEMERLFRLGADGIFTDYPARARRVLDRLAAGRAVGTSP